MKLYILTGQEMANEILARGFSDIDIEPRYVRRVPSRRGVKRAPHRRGVWLSTAGDPHDWPSEPPDGDLSVKQWGDPQGDVLLSISMPVDIPLDSGEMLSDWEFVEIDQSHRWFLVPAEILNRHRPPEVVAQVLPGIEHRPAVQPPSIPGRPARLYDPTPDWRGPSGFDDELFDGTERAQGASDPFDE